VTARASCVAIAVLAAAASACGGTDGADAGLPPSGEAISCGALMYILSGQCVSFPPFSAAAVEPDGGQDGAADGGASGDAVSSSAAPDSGTTSDPAAEAGE
jgi:hypothetical protein